MTSVQAGEVEAVHAITTENVWKQQGVDVQGQTDILTMGLPYICPYNVNSIMNPILVASLWAWGTSSTCTAAAPGAPGWRADPPSPHPPRVPPGHHPSYIDFYEQVLTQTVDPVAMHKQFEESFATDPWYIHLYRTRGGHRPLRRAPVLHVAGLGAPAHPGAPGAGHHRRRRSQGRAPAWLLAGLVADRRAGNQLSRRGRPRPLPSTHLHAPPAHDQWPTST